MYQWMQRTDTETKLHGRDRTDENGLLITETINVAETTYSYHKGWSAPVIDSRKFHDQRRQ